MTPRRRQEPRPALWALARRQHGVVTHDQLLEVGLTEDAIRHRIASGRLHRVWPRVYAVGRPELDLSGQWLAAVLTCGPGAALSHQSAGELWRVRPWACGPIEVSIPCSRAVRRPAIVVHRRVALDSVSERDGIPVTSPECTLIDLGVRLSENELAQMVREADKLRLVRPDELRAAVEASRQPGAGALRRLLDRESFTLTDSELERRFLPLVKQARLPRPLTQVVVNGVRVDFFFPDLGLVVETDGLRYHRTPSQQAADLKREQLHAAAGLTTLRFTHGQVVYDPEHVVETLRQVADHASRRALEESAAS